MSDVRKTTWVLGSGFSRSLGGPLLNELMDRARYRRLNSLFLKGLDQDGEVWSKLHTQWGEIINAFHSASGSDGVPWRDAEEFVELLQLAALPSVNSNNESEQAQEVLRQHVPTKHWTHDSYGDRARQATRLLAAMTHEFIAYSSKAQTERWQPYRHWVEQLDVKADQVITFNWDLVVELAFEAVHSQRPARSGLDHNGEWLHKLHGSIDWISSDRATIQAVTDPFYAITSTGAARRSELALGVPGPGKHLSCDGIFKPMWNAARRALADAQEIIFVGYRFPPSDSFARRELLDAISNNSCQSLKIRVVLGPKRDDDVLRLEGLLKWSLSKTRCDVHKIDPRSTGPTYELIQEPMRAEDFMTVYRR